MMNELFGEFLGTLILILLGNGVVAGVVLPKTKSNSSGWIVITMGWGIAVAVAVFVSGKLSPAYLNPAVTNHRCGLKRWFALGFRFALYLSPVRRGHAGSDFGLVAIQTSL
ncbi:glycerol uptake facilitator protein [Streptococcus pneumoniae]|nr:glycerol uptake facilitator protein [Streptococcus pneumoniae]